MDREFTPYQSTGTVQLPCGYILAPGSICDHSNKIYCKKKQPKQDKNH